MNQSILISGIGVAGPTLAYWLSRSGFEVSLVEQAPELRSGGYLVDFWGAGYTVAERMGLLPGVREYGYEIDELRLVDARGRRTGGFSIQTIRSLLRGRFVSIRRSDLSKLLFESLRSVDVVFSDSIKAITPASDGVRVEFEQAGPRCFGLVIGADGLHSNVRTLAFGKDAGFERHLGYYTASFSVDGYPYRDGTAYVAFTAPGRQVARYALRDNRTVFFFIFAAPSRQIGRPISPHDRKALLHEIYGRDAWECRGILQCLDTVQDLYFDDVSQIRMEHWSNDRIALVGDACACPSLLAGQGASLAMAEAYVLADELRRSGGDHATAFARYEARLHAFVTSKQENARSFGSWFAPRTRLGIFARDQATRLMRVPFVAEWCMGAMLRDDLPLPDCDC